MADTGASGLARRFAIAARRIAYSANRALASLPSLGARSVALRRLAMSPIEGRDAMTLPAALGGPRSPRGHEPQHCPPG